MAEIAEIISVAKRKNAEGEYYITTVRLTDGLEATGFGKDYKVGEKVMAGYHEKYNKVKIWKLTK